VGKEKMKRGFDERKREGKVSKEKRKEKSSEQSTKADSGLHRC